MQRTESQQNASRENGAKSRGPVTPEGKARSSQNGTTHGLFSTALLLKKESREAWNLLSNDLVARFQPADNIELNIIYEMASATWRAQRATAMEAAIINMEIDVIGLTEAPGPSPENDIRQAAEAYCKAVGRDKAVIELGRQSIRLNNLWMRLYKQLKELQKDRQPVPGPPSEPERKSEPEKPQAPPPQQHPAQPGREGISSDFREFAAKAAKEPCTGQ